MQRYFGPEGLLAKTIAQFEFRASQWDMAQAVQAALADGMPLLVEAGTGTGKTWAYLIPAILSGKKVVVSTGTKTLQDQILDHDIPFLRRSILPTLRAVCLKGRKNYLCLRRFRDFSYQPTLYNKEEAKLYRRFQQWAARTKTGDRAEIEWLPDQFYTWHEVSSSSEQCLGQNCSDHPRCFVTRLRAEASQAHLLIVNHHLFFADLSVRRRGTGEVIPDYDAVIFDEAHQLEDTVGLYFGIQFSTVMLHELMRDLLRECKKNSKKASAFPGIQKVAQHLDPLARVLHHSLYQPRGNFGRFPLDLRKTGEEFPDTCRQIVHALEQLNGLLAPFLESDPAFESFHRRALELAHAIREVMEQSDESLVYWYEQTQQSLFIHGTPIQVASILNQRLFTKTPATVMTSATLSVAGSFDFFRSSLGMPPATREMLLPSPFAYEKQALLYIPTRFPTPQEPSFCSTVAEQAFKILTKTRGRALFLFTSYRNMNEVHQRLRDRLPYPILVQGQKPKRALLAEFRERIDSVLLATSSFWQGIDVPGDSLSCLLIDKLPFEVPDDPIIAARMDQVAKEGRSPFFDYQVPRAIIHLKQGVGRLIRSSQDRGIIVIFDVRLTTKSYGHLFLKSLPPCRVVHQLDQMDGFLFPRESESENVQGGELLGPNNALI